MDSLDGNRQTNHDDTNELLHRLGERVKELTALHKTARILQDDSRPSRVLIEEVLALLPPAWQYPEITGARIHFQDLDVRSENFATSDWIQTATFTTRTGQTGGIEVCYLKERPEAVEGPFLAEERDLIDSLAEMMRSYFQQKTAYEELEAARDDLEAKVHLRTEQLEAANESLQEQIVEYRRAQEKIDRYQRQLRKLASELSLTEERQRRTIARDLHDHIGQAMAFMRMRLTRLQGDAVFSGLEGSLSEITKLLDQTINSTRSLTFEISPPVLYELGLRAAFDWLAEQFGAKHSLNVKVRADGLIDRLPDDSRVALFKSVQELLVNAVKHAGASQVVVNALVQNGRAVVNVADNGCGFDVRKLSETAVDSMTFGLFSIRERLEYMGGEMSINSQVGRGTEVKLVVPIVATSLRDPKSAGGGGKDQ